MATSHMAGNGPGIRRVRRGRAFQYRTADGRLVRDRATLARIRALAIPPAWRDVWIAASDRTRVQATGRDARGRKQHRYHAAWTTRRDRAKFAGLVEFGRRLPTLRRRLRRDLAGPGLTHRRVVALVVRLLERTLIRVGNAEYARTNGSFGLTTIRDRHVVVRGRTARFRFRGKGGKRHEVAIADDQLARLIGQCRRMPGRQLFQYADDGGRRHAVTSADVNRYVRRAMGEAASAKAFRTWAATVLAVRALRARATQDASRRPAAVVDAVAEVAAHLGNTPAVCRRSYIHPAVIAAYLDGTLPGYFTRRPGQRLEARVLALLDRRRSPRRP